MNQDPVTTQKLPIGHPKLPRVWKNMRPEQYHEAPGLSSTALRHFVRKGPLEFYARYIAKTKANETSDAMRLGRAFHAAMEDETKWRGEFILMTDTVPNSALVDQLNNEMAAQKSAAKPLVPGDSWNMRLPSHQEFHKRIKLYAATVGKDVLTPADVMLVEQQIAAVYDNPACREFVGDKSINVEMACFLEQQGLPWPLKALCDLLTPTTVVDFKTTAETHPHDFIRDAIYRRGYDYQLAYYCLVTGRRRARIISVNSEPPIEANVFRIPKRRLIELMDEQRRHIDSLVYIHDQGLLDTDIDSQGIPASWHSELWRAVMPLDIRFTEGVAFEGDDAND